MHPFVHLSIVFWLYKALQCRKSMSSNSLIFHTSGGISSSPAAFLFLIFLSTELSSSYINCPSLMSYCLLIILVIVSCINSRNVVSIIVFVLVGWELSVELSQCSSFCSLRLPFVMLSEIFYLQRNLYLIDLILYVFCFFLLGIC